MTLEEIALKHGTLKVHHGYMPIYERFFAPLRDDKITLVEIGVAEGYSLNTWFEYFDNARIIGLEKELSMYVKKFSKIEVLKCDVVDPIDTEMAVIAYKQADIIIDDGSHRAHEQLCAFRDLWASVKPGGWYVIEDLFTLFDPVWNPMPQHTIIAEIAGRMQSILVGGDSIQEVHYFGRNDINGIMFLRKRSEAFRIQPLSEFQ